MQSEENFAGFIKNTDDSYLSVNEEFEPNLNIGLQKKSLNRLVR